MSPRFTFIYAVFNKQHNRATEIDINFIIIMRMGRNYWKNGRLLSFDIHNSNRLKSDGPIHEVNSA